MVSVIASRKRECPQSGPNSAANPLCRGWPKHRGQLDHVDAARSRRQWQRSGGRWLQASAVQRHRSWEGKALFAWVPSISTRHREDCAIENAAKIRTWNPNARLPSADCIDLKPGPLDRDGDGRGDQIVRSARSLASVRSRRRWQASCILQHLPRGWLRVSGFPPLQPFHHKAE